MRTTCLGLLILLFCGSCKEQHDHGGRTPLVELDGNFLYHEDLQAVLPAGLSKDDSLLFAEHYIRNWAEDVLLYEKAQSNIPNSGEIDKLVENYRKALIMHAYQQALINQTLSEEISETELADYYEKHQELFKVESPLIKGLFIKVPLTAPQLSSVRRWYRTENREAVEHLEKYSLQNAVKYEYFYDKWVPITEVMDLMPLKVPDAGEYLNKNRHVELKDTAFHFKFVVLFALTLLAGSTVYGQDNVIDEVVWVVGDEAILKSEVEEARMSALYEGRKFDRDPYCVIPEEIAVQKLFLHQAALDSIEVSESEVIQRVDYMTNMYISNIGSREKMEEYFNKTSSQIRETLRENAREGLKVQKMQQKLVGEIKVTPAEVRRYFKDLPQDSIPYIPTQVEVQIITQQPKVPLEEIENVKKRLRDFTDRITKGETSFSTLARMYSEDRGSAIRGGEIEFSGRGMLDPAYANVAFNLQDPNKVSKIVESEYGFHIIQLIEKRGDRIKTRHILLKPHIPEESLTAGMARLDSIADDIRNGKFSFEEAASVLSQDKDTRNNHGLLPNPNTNTSKFEMQELPPEIAKVVDKMKVGEISEAFTMIPQKTGKEECVIVKLKSRTNGHKATVADDYQNLKEIVLEKRRDEMLDKWIREKQKHTYVRINENWRNCTFKYPGWIKD